MSHATMNDTRSASLQSKDYGQLLDVIDLLRSQGISQYVPLPQLIVCGDQSSGKSSVLEAVSGVRFPTKDNLCTRFATELILRRRPVANAKAVIVPGAERSDEEKEKLLSFKVPTVSIEEFPSLIEKAKEAMGLSFDGKAFSDDVLRVEISGPEQPQVTLVDLPGLIHAENKQQSARDVHLVSTLVRSYMANSRSIILAVVSAKNDFSNQIVTKLARDVDPKGLRTLGIITKPDTLHAGSESEKAFLNLAKNEDVVFRLGWHVLKNRDYISRECSGKERDDAEMAFFSQGVWTSLPTNCLGIGALNPRLSTVLRNQIVSEMPSLIRDVEAGINECRGRRARLGEARGTLQEKRLYLVHISHSFSSLVTATVGGVYVHDFFGDATTQMGYTKRLRAVIQNTLLDFADDMRREGHDQEIIEDAPDEDDFSVPRRISRSDYIDGVRTLMRRSRGCELPGTFNPLIVGDLFYQQSSPWKRLVERYYESILQATKQCLDLILNYTTDETTRDGLLREIIDPAMDRYTKELGFKISEIMRPHQKGHPITYNENFTETIQKARKEHDKKNLARQLNVFFKLRPDKDSSYIQPNGFDTGDLLNALTQRTDEDMDRYACSEAVDCMEAYYKVSVANNPWPPFRNDLRGRKQPSRRRRLNEIFKREVAALTYAQVAMKVMVDSFSALGIEYCLLDGLSDILSPSTVIRLDEKLIDEIAAETEDSQVERARIVRKLESLEAGLQTLNRFGRHKPVEYDLEEESDQGRSDDGLAFEEINALLNGEPLQEEEERLVERAGSPHIRDVVAEEPVLNLSPFNGNGTSRADDSWHNGRWASLKKKKTKRMTWPVE